MRKKQRARPGAHVPSTLTEAFYLLISRRWHGAPLVGHDSRSRKPQLSAIPTRRKETKLQESKTGFLIIHKIWPSLTLELDLSYNIDKFEKVALTGPRSEEISKNLFQLRSRENNDSFKRSALNSGGVLIFVKLLANVYSIEGYWILLRPVYAPIIIHLRPNETSLHSIMPKAAPINRKNLSTIRRW